MDGVDRRLLLTGAGFVGVAALARAARAGQLTPPPGPITSTGTSLGALSSKVAFTDHGISEPRRPIRSCPSGNGAMFRITEPGAYCMTDNIEQVCGMDCCISIECDGVDIDGQGFAFVRASGPQTCQPSPCLKAFQRNSLELYDCAFLGWSGDCCSFRECDDVSISDVLFCECTSPFDAATGSGGCVIECRHHCECDDIVVSKCDGAAIRMGDKCWATECRMSQCAAAWILLGQRACIDSCAVIECTAAQGGTAGAINGFIQCGPNSECCESEVRECVGAAFRLGECCVNPCCEVSGGSGGAFVCPEGGCDIDDCSVVNHDGLAVQAGPRTSIEDCKFLNSGGVECMADCVCEWNEISTGSGGGGGGSGGAIFVLGERCCVTNNSVYAGGIVVAPGGNGCLIQDNHVGGAGGPPGTGGGFIAVAQGATNCHVANNHVRRSSMTNAISIAPGNSFGPICNCIAGGDLGLLAEGRNPFANFVF